MKINEVKIIAQDGYSLAGHVLVPAKETKGSVLIAPAMGVNQLFYHPLAQWLCKQGYAVVTFDYRGIGLSQQGPLKNLKADIFDWANLDCTAAVDFITKEFPEQPLTWIGHSLGGQVVPFVTNNQKIKKIITVATGSGYWIQNSLPLLIRVWWLWFFLVPILTPILGYFPGKTLRKVGDLPKGVINQWRNWCLNPEYAVGYEGPEVREKYAQVSTPIVSLSFSDDEFMSAKNTTSIHSFYTGSEKKMVRIKPSDIKEKRIGHFGFFKRKFENSLWQKYLLPNLPN